MKPLIGITLDHAVEGTFSKRPHYALRESYFDIIYKAGGIPVAIPYLYDAIDEYLERVSAIIVPGGDYAFADEWYVKPDAKKPYKPSKRFDFDVEITKRVLEKNKPFLGICAGMQVLGCINGAKMTPNINDYFQTDIDHLNAKPAEEFAHNVIVKEGSLLHKITGRKEFPINTAHIEAIVKTPEDVIVSGVASDDVIEAIELPKYNFALGVQWHPEFFMQDDDPNFMIFKEFVKAGGGVPRLSS